MQLLHANHLYYILISSDMFCLCSPTRRLVQNSFNSTVRTRCTPSNFASLELFVLLEQRNSLVFLIRL
jgi:hypothetical protein